MLSVCELPEKKGRVRFVHGWTPGTCSQHLELAFNKHVLNKSTELPIFISYAYSRRVENSHNYTHTIYIFSLTINFPHPLTVWNLSWGAAKRDGLGGWVLHCLSRLMSQLSSFSPFNKWVHFYFFIQGLESLEPIVTPAVILEWMAYGPSGGPCWGHALGVDDGAGGNWSQELAFSCHGN